MFSFIKRNDKTIFADEATNKELISKIYKQLMQLNIKKKKNQTTQSNYGWKIQHFSKEDIQIDKNTHEKILNIANY